MIFARGRDCLTCPLFGIGAVNSIAMRSRRNQLRTLIHLLSGYRCKWLRCCGGVPRDGCCITPEIRCHWKQSGWENGGRHGSTRRVPVRCTPQERTSHERHCAFVVINCKSECELRTQDWHGVRKWEVTPTQTLQQQQRTKQNLPEGTTILGQE